MSSPGCLTPWERRLGEPKGETSALPHPRWGALRWPAGLLGARQAEEMQRKAETGSPTCWELLLSRGIWTWAAIVGTPGKEVGREENSRKELGPG